ncbi:GNAT family N-acetyltransferase [Brevundimonas aveniformis]|uniref:GNAT family N-acetyltransferase n=1 Tax=Brevundimonas aveniformis TaxID=370977 RepID=UPI002491137C|nr:GNAT family N-acetyltransferase [Brevundimonas aveniformis]
MILRLADRTTDDAEAFCALSNSLYARKVTPEYFFWQFHDGPNRPSLATAWEDGRMIAAYGVHVCAGDATRPARAMTLDNMVAEDAQGRGLVRQVAALAHEHARGAGTDVLCVVANARSLRAHERHFGWQRWRTLRDWQATTSGARDVDAQVVEVAAPDAGLATLQTDAFYARTPDFLSWRTQANPRYAYRWVEVRSSAGLRLGQAATKLFRDPTSGAGFGDIVALHVPDSGDVPRLVGALQHWFRTQAVSTVVTYPIGSDQERALLRLGFEPTARERYVVGQGQQPPRLSWGMLDVDVY